MAKKKCRILNREEIIKRIQGFKDTRDFPVEQMKGDDGEIPIFKVRKASLNDQIEAREFSSSTFQLLTKMMKKMKDGEDFDMSDILHSMQNRDMNPKTDLEIRIFQRCVVEPKFTYDEVLDLSKV